MAALLVVPINDAVVTIAGPLDDGLSLVFDGNLKERRVLVDLALPDHWGTV